MNPYSNKKKQNNSEYEKLLDFIENVYVICDDNKKKELINQLIDTALEENVDFIKIREKVSSIDGSKIKALYTINLSSNLDFIATKSVVTKIDEFPIHECIMTQNIHNYEGINVICNEFKEKFYDNVVNISRVITECEGYIGEYFLDGNNSLFEGYRCFTLSDVYDKKIEPLDSIFVLRYGIQDPNKSYSDIAKVDGELLTEFETINAVIEERKNTKTKVIK